MTEKVKNITEECNSIKSRLGQIEELIKQLQEDKVFLNERYKIAQSDLLEAVKEALMDPKYDK